VSSVVHRERFRGKRPKRIRPRPNGFILYSQHFNIWLCASRRLSRGRILSLSLSVITLAAAAAHCGAVCASGLHGVGSRRRRLLFAAVSIAPPSTDETAPVLIATVKKIAASDLRDGVRQLRASLTVDCMHCVWSAREIAACHFATSHKVEPDRSAH